jgi:hypothetical protein
MTPMKSQQNPYAQGFELGSRDGGGDAHAAEEAAVAFDRAEQTGAPLLDREQEYSFWLGYYHGRSYARTGRMPSSGQPASRSPSSGQPHRPTAA